MYVSEANFLPSTGMRVRVVSMEGQDYIADLKPDMKVDAVKIMSLSHFLPKPAESMKSSLYHKILLVRTGKILNEEKTVAEEGITNNDELVLLKKRIAQPKFETKDPKDECKKKITGELIRSTTSSLVVSTPVKNPAPPASTHDFQTELRKILVSLIDASQKILCLNPEASKIFKQAEDMLKESKEPLSQKVDQSLVKQLTDMGFPEDRAKKALILNKSSVMSAMDWMIKHEADPDIDEPLVGSTEDNEEVNATVTTSESTEADEGAVGGTPSNNRSMSSPQVTNILQSLRAFRKREFKPRPRVLQNLIEMGFEEKDAIEALRIGRNDQDAACDWLLGDRKTKAEDIEEGIDTSSPIYKAIMANPTVQLGLNNPRCLLAFLQMLESPIMTHQWLNDPETGPLIVQISRIYHSEKHSAPDPPARNSSSNALTRVSSVNSDRDSPPRSRTFEPDSRSRIASRKNSTDNNSRDSSSSSRDSGTPTSRSSSGKSKGDSLTKSKGR